MLTRALTKMAIRYGWMNRVKKIREKYRHTRNFAQIAQINILPSSSELLEYIVSVSYVSLKTIYDVEIFTV